MGTILLDPTLREKLNGLNDQMELRDENDKLVGAFLPAAAFQALVGSVEIPFTAEERVTWTPAAEADLANLWVLATDRPMVTLACDHIDALLRINPYAQSQEWQ